MDKANIIISIIIVLCIAAAVAAYGITNSDSPIFSDLSSMSASSDDSGDGLGNSTSLDNGSGVSVTTPSSSEDSSYSGSDSSSSGSSEGSYSSSSGSSSSGSSGSGSSSSDSGSSEGSDSGSSDSGSSDDTSESRVSASTIKSDAWNHIGEEGCYPGAPYFSDSYWYVTIYDSNGSAVDSFQYTASGEFLGRG